MTDLGGDNPDIPSALWVELETDRLLGLRAWPIVGTPSEVLKTQPVDPAELAARNQQLRQLDEKQVRVCTRCGLAETRTQTVFGQGHPAARVVFIGEAPGFEEDRQGLAFVGRAGQLLTRMIAAMGLQREDVFIGNVLKCRPPNNRTPAADEIANCCPYLFEQIGIINPEVIVALGAPAAQTLLNTHEGIGRLRGRFHDFVLLEGPSAGKTIPLMPTFHPAYLLRSPDQKRKAWEDLQMVMEFLGLPLSQ
jgi:uracil-DNA glycosylase family 4